MGERKRRSIAKAFSWRVTATLTTTIISYWVTGSAGLALKIGGFEFFIKMFVYYFHERGWLKIKYGMDKPLDYQI